MKENSSYSQFRAMMAVARASFISMMRSPSTIVFSIVFPLVFIFAFGFINDGFFVINIATAPGIDRESNVYQELAHNRMLRLSPAEIYPDVNDKLERGQIDAILDIRKNHAEGYPKYFIFYKTTTASPDKAALLKLIINELAERYNLVEARVENQAIKVRQEKIEGRKFKTIDFILPGQLGFSLLSTGVFGTAFVFFNFRQTLVIKRFFATPIRRIYIILGEAVSRMVFSLLGALALILIGSFAFDFTLIQGWQTVVYMLLLSALGLIVFMGFGFIISGLAKNSNTIPPLSNIITLPQFILSGTFFSIDLLPSWLQAVSNVLPLTYLNNAFRKLAFEGAPLSSLSIELGVLLAWGVVIYLAAAKTFKWE